MHGSNVSTPPAVLPVAECGVCDRCGGITVRGACQGCGHREVRSESPYVRGRRERRERKARGEVTPNYMAERMAETQRRADRVLLRPTRVRVVEHQDQDQQQASDDVAVLTLPEHVSEPARQVAHVVATIATARLAWGDSLEFALQKIAAGRDQIARQLSSFANLDETTTAYDRKTVARALQELVDLRVLKRVGQLNEWRNEEGAPRRGAYVYALNVTCRKLGQLTRQATAKAAGPLHASVRVMGLPRRIAGALSAAIRQAQPGNRNHYGHWLACRCTEAGLNEGQTMKVMEVYCANVAQHGQHYTLREAQATVRSRYRRKLGA